MFKLWHFNRILTFSLRLAQLLHVSHFLEEDGRKLMGLKPLAEIIPNWKELLPVRGSTTVDHFGGTQ